MQNNIQEDLKLFNILVQEFLASEKNQPTANYIPVGQIKNKVDLKLNDKGISKTRFQELIRQVLLKTPKTSSKVFFNQLFGGRHSKAVLGDLLTVFLNNSMATYKIAGLQVNIEKQVIKKVCQLIGYPKNSGGTFPTGGSMCNFMSLVMARDKKNKEIKELGYNNQKMVVYTSESAHYSISKNTSFIGIGKKNIRYIKSNDKGAINTLLLEQQIKKDIKNNFTPTYLNATAGTTVMCAFDDVRKLVKICKKYKIWLHLDGAFGGSVIFSKKYKILVEGISKTDSFCFNAHKTLGAPLSTSVLVVRNQSNLLYSFNNEAKYLYQTENKEYNLGRTSFECGRRNNALKFWTLWKSIGTNGLEKMVDYEFSLAEYARSYISSNKDYILYSFDNSLSICFNYKNINPKKLCAKLYEQNKLLVGYGEFSNNTFIRLVTINSQNTKEDILNFFVILEKFAQKLLDSKNQNE